MTKASSTRPISKIELLINKLKRPSGATLVELTKATGWQEHCVRGAMAGALRKKGFTVASDKVDGVRRYRIAATTTDA